MTVTAKTVGASLRMLGNDGAGLLTLGRVRPDLALSDVGQVIAGLGAVMAVPVGSARLTVTEELVNE